MIQINVTEAAAPKNVATLDRPDLNLTGNAYSKEQTRNEITKGFATAVRGEAIPTSSPTPWVAGNPDLFEKWEVHTAGTYVNFKDSSNNPVVVSSGDLVGNLVYIEVSNGKSKKAIISLQNISGSTNIPDWTANIWTAGSMVIYKKEIYKTEVDTTATMIPGTAVEWVKKVGNERVDAILKYFLEYEEGYKKIVFQPSKWLRRDGGSFSATANMTCYNIDVTDYNKLFYNGKPSVIHFSEETIYCAIMGVKSDGTVSMLRASNSITGVETTYNFPFVNEVYDISDYVSISVSLGDLGGSVNPNPDCYIINSELFTTPGAPVINAVKKYIDSKIGNNINPVKPLQGNTILNKIHSGQFSVDNTTLLSGATIDLGNIISPANSVVTIKENSLNENSEMSFIYKETLAANVMVGFKSYHPSNEYGHSAFVKYHSNGANFGKIEIIGRPSLSFSELSTASNNNYNVGDVMRVGLIRTGLTYKAFAQNLTKSWKIEFSLITTPAGTPFFAHNSASPQLRNNGGSVSVLGFSHVFTGSNIENAIIGDSITLGQSVPTEAERWGSLVKGNNIVMGGGADVTESVLKRVPEIIKMKPRRALLMIGGNDYFFAVPDETWKQRLRDIRNQLTDAEIEVVHCFPTPRAGAGQLIAFIKSEFITDAKIDTNTPLSNGSTEILSGAFNSGDGLHLNPNGGKKVAEIINNFLVQ